VVIIDRFDCNIELPVVLFGEVR